MVLPITGQRRWRRWAWEPEIARITLFVKYAALRELGIDPDDLRLVVVSDIKRKTLHAVVAVHFDEEWLILDNRMLIMVNAVEARHYYPLFVLDHRGVREAGTTAFRR